MSVVWAQYAAAAMYAELPRPAVACSGLVIVVPLLNSSSEIFVCQAAASNAGPGPDSAAQPVPPGTFWSWCVYTSPIPRIALFWQAYSIGSPPQAVNTGNPSAATYCAFTVVPSGLVYGPVPSAVGKVE